MNANNNTYYLNAMGIQQWIPREPEAPSPTLNWDQLREQVSQCQKCKLCQTRTQTVFGVGSQQADLLIVGEAPGFYEDKQGEPFVGRAGQLLNKMLQTIGLQREQVFIANVLKCRPPNNRDPLLDEVATCTPYLNQQIQLLKPKVILAVGRYAGCYLLRADRPMYEMRGRVHRYVDIDIPLIVSYHPAYLLRSPADKAKSFADLHKVAELLNETQ